MIRRRQYSEADNSIWARGHLRNAQARENAICLWNSLPLRAEWAEDRNIELRADVAPVLLVTPWYRPTVGGVVEVADRLFRTLSAAGVKTTLLVCDQEPEGRVKKPGVRYMILPCGAFYHGTIKSVLGMLLRAVAPGIRLWRLLRRERIKTIVIIYPTGHSWLLLLLRRLMGLRLIVSCHGSDLWETEERLAPMQWLVEKTLHAADAITVTAIHLAAKARFLVRRKPRPICLIQNCIDTNYFVPPPPDFRRANGTPTLLHISNFAPKKRVNDILDAFAIAKLPPNTRLLMVGEGRELNQCVQHAKELKIDSQVSFVGATDDVRPYLWQSDLLVLASDEESGPLVLLEAMSCEVPFVATPGGIASRLPPNEAGLVVPPRRSELLAEAMTKLMQDDRQRAAMAKRGRQIVKAQFSEDIYVRKHLNLIKQIEISQVPPYHVTLLLDPDVIQSWETRSGETQS